MFEQTEKVEKERFEARDQSGHTYTIIVFETYLSSLTHSGKSRTLTGRYLRTAQGDRVNRIGEKIFLLVKKGLRLTRI
jgi:hypothetical protein